MREEQEKQLPRAAAVAAAAPCTTHYELFKDPARNKKFRQLDYKVADQLD